MDIKSQLIEVSRSVVRKEFNKMEVTEDSPEEFIHDQFIETFNDNPFQGSYWHKVKNVEIKNKILAMIIIFVIVITMIIGIHFGSAAPPTTKGMYLSRLRIFLDLVSRWR